MELQYFGANCIKVSTKKANIIIDDDLKALGLKSIIKKDDVCLYTTVPEETSSDAKISISTPGEYEVSNVSIKGVAARSHVDEEGQVDHSTMFRIVVEDFRLVVLGHIYPELNDNQLEYLGTTDILIVPVGGNGYTLDSIGALKLIKKIEPKIVIPVHYDDKDVKYPVPQQPLEEVLKGLAMEVSETTDKLKLKTGDIGEGMRLVVLNRQ